MTLTKPRIMSLLLLTGACGMFVGAGGVPPLGDLAVLLVGLGLACGGASALNHYLDRDIDRLMGKRTRSRPVASGRVPPESALEFGLALSALSFVLLGSLANVLTATLALVGNLFYVLVYTRWLKRSTPQNIVIGGAAGAVPPLVGWAAATGNLALPALALFAIVFFWTPPHFWALALLIKRDYAAAGVPMPSVVRGERETARQIVLYTLVLIAVTLVPVGFGVFGALYLTAALALGGAFLWLALRLRRELVPGTRGRALPLLARLPRPPLRRDGARPGARVNDRSSSARTSPGAGACSCSSSRFRRPSASRCSTWTARPDQQSRRTRRRDLPGAAGRARERHPASRPADLFDTTGLATTYGSILFVDHVPEETAEAVRRWRTRATRTWARRTCTSSRTGSRRRTRTSALCPTRSRPAAGRRLERRQRGRGGGRWPTSRSARTRAVFDPHPRSLVRPPRIQADRGLVPLDGCFPLALSFDHTGPIARTVEDCEQAMRPRAELLEPRRLDSLEDVRVGVAWTELRRPAVRARVEETAARFPHRVQLELLPPDGTYELFMREVGDVHRELHAEHADSYGDNVRPKIERCVAITEHEADGSAQLRDVLRERYLELTADVDLVVTPTIPFVPTACRR